MHSSKNILTAYLQGIWISHPSSLFSIFFTPPLYYNHQHHEKVQVEGKVISELLTSSVQSQFYSVERRGWGLVLDKVHGTSYIYIIYCVLLAPFYFSYWHKQLKSVFKELRHEENVSCGVTVCRGNAKRETKCICDFFFLTITSFTSLRRHDETGFYT